MADYHPPYPPVQFLGSIIKHQIAGLALIGKYLGDSFPISISIMHLYPEDIESVGIYSEFYNLV